MSFIRSFESGSQKVREAKALCSLSELTCNLTTNTFPCPSASPPPSHSTPLSSLALHLPLPLTPLSPAASRPSPLSPLSWLHHLCVVYFINKYLNEGTTAHTHASTHICVGTHARTHARTRTHAPNHARTHARTHVMRTRTLT